MIKILNAVKVLIEEKKLGKEIAPQKITPREFPPWTIAPG